MKRINLRGLSEIMSERELKNVMGGSYGGNCYNCSVDVTLCEGGGSRRVEGLFCGTEGLSYEEIIDNWMSGTTTNGAFCDKEIISCTRA